MKKNKLIIMLTLISFLFGNSFANENNKMMGESTKALKSKKLKQNIKWSGIVVNTVVNKDSTCFQIAETVPFNGDIPKYTLLNDDSRFITCKSGKYNKREYNGRLLTVYGNVVGFYNSDNKNGDYSIVEASNIKRWRRQRPVDSYWNSYGNTVQGGPRGPETYHNAVLTRYSSSSRGL